MTQHDHAEYVPGCFRCDLSRAEVGVPTFTLRQYLMMQASLRGTHWSLAAEAIASVAIEHPEWDMDGRRKTWDEWAKEKTDA